MTLEDIYMHYDIVGINDERNESLDIYTKGTITRIKRQREQTKVTCKEYIT